jgi:mono/diheme cytochrome c family protein
VQQIHGPIYREKAEPRDGYQPIPMWLLLPVFALLLWGGWYLGAHSWRLSSRSIRWFAALTSLPVDGPQPLDPMLLGRRVYASCASCHQADGQGVAGAYPPLAGAEWVTGDPRVLSRILLHGLEGPISVRGAVYSGVMPAWANLSDAEIAAVLTYIRNSWGNEAGDVPSDLVAEVRRSVSTRTTPWSAEELDQIAEQLRDSNADKDPPADGGSDAEDREPGDDAV